jgi:hypothetical protein
MILELKMWIHSLNKRVDDPTRPQKAGGEFGVRRIARMATFALGPLLTTILFTR